MTKEENNFLNLMNRFTILKRKRKYFPRRVPNPVKREAEKNLKWGKKKKKRLKKCWFSRRMTSWVPSRSILRNLKMQFSLKKQRSHRIRSSRIMIMKRKITQWSI